MLRLTLYDSDYPGVLEELTVEKEISELYGWGRNAVKKKILNDMVAELSYAWEHGRAMNE